MTDVTTGVRSRHAPWFLLLATAVTVFVADLVTKVLVRDRITPGEPIEIIPGVDLIHTTNRGIAFGMFPDRQRIVAVVTAIVLCGLAVVLLRVAHRSRMSMIAAGALVGGAIGNLLDRLQRDGVTDFIDIWRWPPFNIADIGVVLGAAVLAITLTRAPVVMTDLTPIEFRVSEAQEGKRLDVVVGGVSAIGSRAEAQRAIDDERVRVNGAVVRKRHQLVRDEVVQIIPAPIKPAGLTPEPMDLAVVYEDDDLLVVDKPAGIVTHPSRGHAEGTLVNGLLSHGISGGEEDLRPGVVHRLDRDTSGLLIVAKRPRAHRLLQAMLRDREIDRRYRVLVHGAFPPAMAVDRPIGRDRRNRTRQSVHSDRPRDARTRFRRLEEFPRFSLLEARLDTGRTHQIRVHLESVNYPVVGDPVYGRPGRDLGLHRQFLHAASLAFPHPETGEPIELVSPLPADLDAALAVLRQSEGAVG